MPSLTGVLEMSLYVEDLDRASRFYEETLGLTRIEGDDRFRAYGVAGRSGLLLFRRAARGRIGPARRPRPAASGIFLLCRRSTGMGKTARRAENCDCDSYRMAARRQEHLFSRPG